MTNILKFFRPSFANKYSIVSYIIRQQNTSLSSVAGNNEQLNTHLAKKQDDTLLQIINTTTDALELFDVVKVNVKEMTGYHAVQSLRSLYNLQKTGHTTIQSSQLLKHPEFERLCRKLKSSSRSIELSDIIESLKFLSFLGVRTNSDICVVLLNLIRQNINDIELNQIVFLNFLLNRFESTPLVEALKIALPILFEINLSVKIDHENLPQLSEFLGFISKNQISNEKCTMNVVSALTLHGDHLPLEIATSIIWSLAGLKKFQPQYERLLHNAFMSVIRNMNQLNFETLETTLSKVIDKYSVQQTPQFYNEELFDKFAELVIQQDIGFIRVIYILKKFNKISYINRPLLDYIAVKAIENPVHIIHARPTALFTFVSSFSTANYIPTTVSDGWPSLMENILNNPLLKSDKNDLPWMKFSLELISLGCFDEQMVEKIFDSQFLCRHLARENHFLDYLSLLMLYQSVVLLRPDYRGKLPEPAFIERAIELSFEKMYYPLRDTLESGFNGGQFVRTKVGTRYGHLIDHLLIFKDGKPLEIDEKCETFEQIRDQADNTTPIAVLSLPRTYYAQNIPRLKGIFELKVKTMEAMGIKVVPVNFQTWLEMPDDEKMPYLIQEIHYKLNEKT